MLLPPVVFANLASRKFLKHETLVGSCPEGPSVRKDVAHPGSLGIYVNHLCYRLEYALTCL